MSIPSATDVTVMKSQPPSPIIASITKSFLTATPAMRSMLAATHGVGALVSISTRKRTQAMYLPKNHHTATGDTTMTTGNATDCLSPLAVSFSDALYFDFWSIIKKSDVAEGMIVGAEFEQGTFSGTPYVIVKLPKSLPLSFGHSTFPFGPISEPEQLDYFNNISPAFGAWSLGVDNLLNHAVEVNAIIAATATEHHDRFPPDQTRPTTTNAPHVLLETLLPHEFPDEYELTVKHLGAFLTHHFPSHNATQARGRDDDDDETVTMASPIPRKIRRTTLQLAADDDEGSESASYRLSMARIKAYFAVLTKAADGTYSLSEPTFDTNFSSCKSFAKKKDQIQQFLSLLASNVESFKDRTHFLAKAIHMQPLTDVQVALYMAGLFRTTNITDIVQSSPTFGPNSLLPPGGQDAKALRELNDGERDKHTAEDALGLPVEHQTKPNTGTKIATKCNSMRDVLNLLGNFNLLISTTIDVSNNMTENPLLYQLIHKLALFMESASVSTWHRSLGNSMKVAHQFYNAVEAICMSLSWSAHNFSVTSNIEAGKWADVTPKFHQRALRSIETFMELVDNASLPGASLSIEPPTYKTPKAKEPHVPKGTPKGPPAGPPTAPPAVPKGKTVAEKAAKEAAAKIEKQGEIHVTDRTKRFTTPDGLKEVLCIPFIRNAHKCTNPDCRFIHKHIYHTCAEDQNKWGEHVEKSDNLEWNDKLVTVSETGGKKTVAAVAA